MPGFMPGIHVLARRGKEDVDGRDKPGHDSEGGVMRGHSRPKDGVLSHAYDPRIHDEAQIENSGGSCWLQCLMDCRVKPGNDQGCRSSARPGMTSVLVGSPCVRLACDLAFH
jgi:hypothetical protein